MSTPHTPHPRDHRSLRRKSRVASRSGRRRGLLRRDAAAPGRTPSFVGDEGKRGRARLSPLVARDTRGVEATASAFRWSRRGLCGLFAAAALATVVGGCAPQRPSAAPAEPRGAPPLRGQTLAGDASVDLAELGGVGFTSVHDRDKAIAGAWAPPKMPTLFLVEADGSLGPIFAGESPTFVRDLEGALEARVGGER